MRPACFLLLALLFLPSLMAAYANVDAFVFKYLKAYETFTETTFNISNDTYYIIYINEEPSLVLNTSWNGSIAMIRDKDQIRSVLLSCYTLQGNTTKLNETDVDELLYYVDAFNESRKKEFDCKAYIGIDRFPCTDLESCWRACYTPVCYHMKVGAGKPFLEFIWEFYNLTISTDSNLSVFRERLLSMPEVKSLQQLDGLTSILNTVENNSIAINNNDLFDPMAMGFCLQVDYNFTDLAKAKMKITSLRNRAFPILAMNWTVDIIAAETADRISLREQFKEQVLCPSLVSNNSMKSSLIKTGLYNLNTTGMAAKLAELENSAKIYGCANMSEEQIQAAQLSFSNLSADVEEYGAKLGEIMEIKDEVGLAINSTRADPLLTFRYNELNSELSQLNVRIDSADMGEMAPLEKSLLELKSNAEDSKRDSLAVFLSYVLGPSAIVAIVVISAVVLFLAMRMKGRSAPRK